MKYGANDSVSSTSITDSVEIMSNKSCRLCGESKNLHKSHAIPDSAFRSLFRQGSGKAVLFIDDDDTKIDYSSDSWQERLLCGECEADLNQRYDSYGIAVLKGNIGNIRRTAEGVSISGFDRQRFRMFAISVVWRMTISPNRAYSGIELGYDFEMEIREALRNKKNVRRAAAEVGLCQLRASPHIKSLSDQNIKNIIISPFSRDFPNFRSVCFLLFGFIIEVFTPRPQNKVIRGVGMCTGASQILFSPYVDITSFPELLNLLVGVLEKNEKNLTKLQFP